MTDERLAQIRERGFTVKHMTALRNAIAATDPNIIDDDDLVAQPAKLLARASRAEQALTIKADEAERLFEERRQLLAALSTERERVIQECAKVCDEFAEKVIPVGTKRTNHVDQHTVAVLRDMAQRIRALSSLPTPPQQTQWIRVDDFVPEYGTVSLVYCREIGDPEEIQIQQLATYSYHGGWCVGDSLESGREYQVTHWQPLPTPPEEAKA